MNDALIEELRSAQTEICGRWCEDDTPEGEETQHCGACQAVGLAIAHIEAEVPIDAPRLALNVAQKLGLPDYSSADASLHISGITAATDDEALQALMATELNTQIQKAKRAKGWE